MEKIRKANISKYNCCERHQSRVINDLQHISLIKISHFILRDDDARMIEDATDTLRLEEL